MIIKGVTYVRNSKFVRASVVVNEETGVIEDVKVGYLVSSAGDEVIDVTNERFRVLPGFIDIHTHLRDLKYSYKEDYFTGTSAAARGGVVLVCDMPNTEPPTNSLSNLMLKLEVARGKALTDYGIYYGMPLSSEELSEVVKYVIGFKFYPNDVFVNPDLRTLAEVIKLASLNNQLLVFHAEDPNYFIKGVGPGMERPSEAEYFGVRYVVKLISGLCRRLGIDGVKVHITHVSSGRTVGLVSGFREYLRGLVRLSIDVTPHHLLLDNSLYSINAGLYKVYPTLKTRLDNLSLYKSLVSGSIDLIASDHAPHALSEKLRDYDEALPGYPGLETTSSILLTMVSEGLLSLEDVVNYYSYAPAKLLGIYPRLGVIDVGSYASLVVIDLKSTWVVKPEEFLSKAKYSPFSGWLLRGRTYLTMVRGRVVYEGNELVRSLRGWGVNVRELMEVKGSN